METIDAHGRKVRPSGWWYLLAPLALVVGIAFGTVAGVQAVLELRDDVELVDPGTATTLTLDADEEVTAWAVWRDGRSSERMDQHAISVRILGPEGPVHYEPIGSSLRETWSFGDRSMLRAGSFTARDAGRHEIRMAFLDANERGEPVAGLSTIGPLDRIGEIVRPMLLGLAAAVIVTIALLVLRRRSRRHVERTAPSASQGPIRFE